MPAALTDTGTVSSVRAASSDRVEESVTVHRQRHNPRAVQALQRAAEMRMRVVEVRMRVVEVRTRVAEVDECYLGLLL